MNGKEGDILVQESCNEKLDSQRAECDVVNRNMKRRRSDLCITVRKSCLL